MATMEYRFHEELNIIELTPKGEVHLKDILNYGSELLEKGLIRDDVIEYVELSGMTNLSIDYISADQLSTMHQKWIDNGWLGSVYYTPLDIEYGIVRMVGAIVECLPHAPQNLMIPLREKIPLNEVRGHLLSNIQPVDTFSDRAS